MPETRTVRVTMWPDRDLQVSEREYEGLRMDGLLLPEEVEPEPAPVAKPAPPKSLRRLADDNATSKEG